MKALRRFTVRTHLPERLGALARLSINLRWSWDKPTQDLFASIDPELWTHTGQDPVALLGVVTPKRLDELAEDGPFLDRLDQLAADLDDYLTRPEVLEYVLKRVLTMDYDRLSEPAAVVAALNDFIRIEREGEAVKIVGQMAQFELLAPGVEPVLFEHQPGPK